MTRTIKAQDVKPGMEIEFGDRGARYCLEVGGTSPYGSRQEIITAVSGGAVVASSDQEVTVLKEPQPDEPTAFGAAVEAGGIWFVRLDFRELKDPNFQPWQSESLIQYTWAQICDQGPVTIVSANPFATPEQDETEPQAWDRWEDVPQGVAVSSAGFDADIIYRRRNQGEIERWVAGAGWPSSILNSRDMKAFGPWVEVRNADEFV